MATSLKTPDGFSRCCQGSKRLPRTSALRVRQSPTEGDPPAALAHRKRAPNRKKKVKASRRYKKAQKKVSKLYRKAANQRQNWVHHEAAQITSGNSLVASEKLEVKNMTRKAKKGSKRKRQKAGLNRSILDVGWGMLKGAIKYKLEEGGGVFVEVPTKTVLPSQTCPKCLHQEKKELDVRTHNCQKCRYTQNRDLAAAEVMILWATNSAANGCERR